MHYIVKNNRKNGDKMYLYRIETDKDKNLNNFEKLEKIIKKAPLASTNSERLKQELENIKEFGTATAFLTLMKLKKQHGIKIPSFCGCLPYSYIAYILDITKINPVKYDLCSYFSAHCPELIHILASDKNDISNITADRIEDLSSSEYSKEVILMWKMVNNFDELTIENFEKFMRLKEKNSKETFRNKIYNSDKLNIENLCNIIAELRISRWTRNVSPQDISNIPDNFYNIFSLTNGKLLYQEQLYEICKKLLGYDYKRFSKLALAIECQNPFTRPLLKGNDEDFLAEVINKSQYLERKGNILHQALLLRKILKKQKERKS